MNMYIFALSFLLMVSSESQAAGLRRPVQVDPGANASQKVGENIAIQNKGINSPAPSDTKSKKDSKKKAVGEPKFGSSAGGNQK